MISEAKKIPQIVTAKSAKSVVMMAEKITPLRIASPEKTTIMEARSGFRRLK